ncbi:MAG: hypothetical protein C4294_19235 [Nitrospiraceae bacterium]
MRSNGRMLLDLQTLKELLFEVRGLRMSDELSYLFGLFARVLSRRLLGLSTLPTGYFLFKDTILTLTYKEGCKFLCQAGTDELLHVMPYFEQDTWKKIKSLVKPGDVCIDVGAHIGVYTIPLARIVGSDGLVVAVEPSPLKQVLSLNIRLNKLQNVVIIGKAAYSERKLLNLYFNPLKTGISSLNKNWMEESSAISLRVEAIPLDELWTEIGYRPKCVKLLKVDVEGAEVEVLRGARNTLKIIKHVVFEAGKQKYRICEEILSSAGFKVELLERSPIGLHNYLATKQ